MDARRHAGGDGDRGRVCPAIYIEAKTEAQPGRSGVTSREFKDRLVRRARRADVNVPPALAAALEQYYRLLALWNQKINLTGLPLSQPEDQTFDRLLIEALVACRYLPSSPLSAMDIGSGSGSPAIPMTLACPDLTMRMVESKTRKAVFLIEALRQLHMERASVETARFEQLLSRPDLHEAVDLVTVRAVRVEARTLMSLQAFLKPAGQLFWFRGAPGRVDSASIPPPLRWAAIHPLMDANGSRLVILAKDLLAAG
jgi:16S rRNA (guanine527-N7)-methyltransferase